MALDKIFQTASTVDDKTMTLQYLDALKALGASPSTKWLLPMELSQLASGIASSVGKGMDTKP